MVNIAEYAKRISHQFHATQTRRNGCPYTVHTDYVGDNSPTFYKQMSPTRHCSDRELNIVGAIGYLHDCLEDVEYTHMTEKLLLTYNPDNTGDWIMVVNGVVTLSRFSKEESVLDYLIRVKASYMTTAVKQTDLKHNLSDLGPGNLRDKYILCQEYLRV